MDPENLALAQEEATLTKIRNYLNLQKVKLWEAPYYDTEKKIPCEVRYKFIWSEMKRELCICILREVFTSLL